MSLQGYQEIISDIEVENDDLRYRLSISTAEQESLTARLHQVLVENGDLQQQILCLEEERRQERHDIYQRELVVDRILQENAASPNLMSESLEFEMAEDMELLRRSLNRAEEDIRVRDRLIDEFEVTVADLHKQYRNNCMDNDITSYDLNQNLNHLEDRLAEANHIIAQQTVKVAELTNKNLDTEDIYNDIVVKYNDQLAVNEELAEKLTATEFDLYATVERLDIIQDDFSNSKPTFVSIGTVTEIVDEDIKTGTLSAELNHVTQKYESSQYRISQLYLDNSTLENRVLGLENQILAYKRMLKDPKTKAPVLSRTSSLVNPNVRALKLEELQAESLRKETELLLRINELSEQNTSLKDLIVAYEDEIFELSEQISLVESEQDESTRKNALSKRRVTLESLKLHRDAHADSGHGKD